MKKNDTTRGEIKQRGGKIQQCRGNDMTWENQCDAGGINVTQGESMRCRGNQCDAGENDMTWGKRRNARGNEKVGKLH